MTMPLFETQADIVIKKQNEIIKKLTSENQQLKAEVTELENLCKECADYIDINRCSYIGYNSELHKKLRKQAKQLKGGEE